MALSHAPSQTPPPAPSRPSRDTIKDRVSIHERPKEIDARTEGGHWEGDLIITRPVLVLHETLATRLAGKTDCDAYASWQKGGVENANGRLRRWLPRQIDIDQVSDQEIQDIVITANLTPRKCLGFKTP